MYGTEQYFFGLTMYGVGAALALVFLYSYRTLLPWIILRRLLFIIAAALLLTPVRAYPDLAFLAPAWFVVVFELLLGEEGEYIRSLTPLIITLPLTVGLYLVSHIAFSVFKRKDQVSGSPKSTEPSTAE